MRQRGFTLLELLIALAIVGALLAILFGGLRVGLAAWRQGEERAEAHQHLRSLSALLVRSVTAAFPYHQRREEGGEAQVQFVGEEGQVSFVTSLPPFPLAAPVAFVAVTLAGPTEARPGFAISAKALPNFDPFEVEAPVFVDPAVTEVRFRYLRPDGDWEERWDGAAEGALPQAVEIRLTARLGGRTESIPTLTIGIAARTP